MSKSNFQPGHKWDSSEGAKAASSVIVNSQPSFLFRKNKGEEHHTLKTNTVSRYGSEDELKRYGQSPQCMTSDTTTRPEEE